MRRPRLQALSAGHALAEGSALGAALREVRRADAAALAEAGDLAGALRRIGLEAQLVRLATAWPAGLLPALRRLRTLPSPFLFYAAFAQLVGYLGLILCAQALIVALLNTKVLPPMAEMAEMAEMQAPDNTAPAGTADLTWWLAGGVIGVPVLSGLVLASASPRVPGWGRQRQRAREAALAAALVEAGAPSEVFATFVRGFDVLRSPPNTLAELDLAQRHSAGAARGNHAAFLAVARLGGLGLLAAFAAAILVDVYQRIANVPVAL